MINNSKKLNPNYISLTRLKAWHPELSLEDLSAIQQRRLTEPFSSLNDLKTFIQNSELIRNGRDFEFPREYESSIQELTFVIESTGIVGQARRSLKLGVRLDPERVKEDQNGGPNPNDGENDGDGDPNDDENDNDGGNENSEAENSKFLDPYVVSIEESWT